MSANSCPFRSSSIRSVRPRELWHCGNQLAILGGIVAFKSVGHVYVDSLQTYADQEPLSESFFVPAAEHGVRYINHISSAGNPAIQSDTAAAISFGFANPLNGGDRCLIGIDCAIGADFLAQVKQVRLLPNNGDIARALHAFESD